MRPLSISRARTEFELLNLNLPMNGVYDEFYLRWLENSVIEIEKAALFSLMLYHLNRNLFFQNGPIKSVTPNPEHIQSKERFELEIRFLLEF